jgi:DNA polymerase III delta subunit
MIKNITIFHGDDVRASRNAFYQAVSSYTDREMRRIDGRTADEASLIQALESPSMFGTKPVVVIENLFAASAKKTVWLTKIGTLLQSEHGSDVVLWEPKTISASVLKYVGSNARVQEFSVPVVLFRFLDSLKPGNGKTHLLLFHEATVRDSPELLHAMLVKRIRKLIMLRENIVPTGLADWQVRRLTSQVRFFTMETLTDLHQKLLDMEYRVKTGSTPFSLAEHLEQMIVYL